MMDDILEGVSRKDTSAFKINEGDILDLRFPASRVLISQIRGEGSIPNDYRIMVQSFVNDVLQRVSENGPVLYSPISLLPDLTVQALSYFYKDQRYYRVAMNAVALEFSRSDVDRSGGVDKLPGFKTFRAFLPQGVPLEAVANDISCIMTKMEGYLTGMGVSEVAKHRAN